MEIISTTKLARKFRMSNRDLEAKLRELGVEPLQAIEISGRKFATWNKALAESKMKEARYTQHGSQYSPLRDELSEIKRTVRKIETMLEKNTEPSH